MWVLAVLGVAVSGCTNAYMLEGNVVQSDVTAAMNVPASDQRLEQNPGIPNAKIAIFRDPDSLGEELVTTGYSDADGTFRIPVDAFGAGWMSERWRFEIYRKGYQRLDIQLRLPTAEKERLLIMLAPGRAMPFDEPEDLMEQYRQFR